MIQDISRVFDVLFQYLHPRYIVHRAEAEAKASEITAQAVLKTAEIYKDLIKRSVLEGFDIQYSQESGISLELNERLKQNLASVNLLQTMSNLRQQENIQQIIAVAAEQLETTNVSVSPDVNPTWLSRFLDEARHISDEDVQALWGKILAGELSNPGKFSLSTLDKLRNFSKSDADLIQEFERHCMISGDIPYIFFADGKGPISYSNMLQLTELGVLQPSEWTSVSITLGRERYTPVRNGQRVILCKPKQNAEASISLPCRLLTRVGIEIVDLTDRKMTSVEEIMPFVEYLKSRKCDVFTATTGYRFVPQGVEELDGYDIYQL